MKRIVVLFGIVFWATLVAASPGLAEALSDARHQRLEGLDDDERALLAPLMERGPPTGRASSPLAVVGRPCASTVR